MKSRIMEHVTKYNILSILTLINIAIKKIVHTLYEAYFICKYLCLLYTSMI